MLPASNQSRSKFETELRRLRAALDAADVGTWSIDLRTGEDTRDATLNCILGLPPAPSTSPFNASLALTHPDDRAVMTSALKRAVDGAGEL